MIYVQGNVQGDLIDPITGERLVVRIPPYHGDGVTCTITDQAREIDQLRQQITALQQRVPPQPPVRVQPRLTVQTTTDDTTPAPGARGVWTSAGYLAPGTF